MQQTIIYMELASLFQIKSDWPVVIGAAEDVNHLLEDELVEKEELQKTLLTPKICHLYRQEAHPRP
jgi:hypothetical protein